MQGEYALFRTFVWHYQTIYPYFSCSIALPDTAEGKDWFLRETGLRIPNTGAISDCVFEGQKISMPPDTLGLKKRIWNFYATWKEFDYIPQNVLGPLPTETESEGHRRSNLPELLDKQTTRYLDSCRAISKAGVLNFFQTLCPFKKINILCTPYYSLVNKHLDIT